MVAEGDGFVVTADQLRARIEEQPPLLRARFSSPEMKKELLESMIRFELLAAEARKRGLDKDPEVLEGVRKLMVQKLVRTSFDDKAGQPSPDDEVRRYYAEHQEEFVQPERVRVSQIFLRADAGSPQRARKAAEAAKLLVRIKAEEAKNPLAFAAIARQVSEDPASKENAGDLGYRTKADLASQLSPAVADAAFGLKAIGQESGVVESPSGLHVLKLTARQPGLNRSFDEVKRALAERMGRERRTEAFDAFAKKLREGAGVKVHEEEVARVGVAASKD